ncbi:MAG: hypothetical protein QW626_03945, partial [Candidatus Hadarchaeales archaeon]
MNKKKFLNTPKMTSFGVKVGEKGSNGLSTFLGALLLISLLAFSVSFVFLFSARTVSASPDSHAPIYI